MWLAMKFPQPGKVRNLFHLSTPHPHRVDLTITPHRPWSAGYEVSGSPSAGDRCVYPLAAWKPVHSLVGSSKVTGPVSAGATAEAGDVHHLEPRQPSASSRRPRAGD